MAEGGEQARSVGMWKTKLERIQGAARRQKAKLYIIAACIALLVCGCTHHPKGNVSLGGAMSYAFENLSSAITHS
ncbi:hypothetical protein ABZP36_013341 [Zizania latifolia]